ncbi:MAG: TAXI family TRAP transporter solute-binding subunit [Phycicoccus sp.]
MTGTRVVGRRGVVGGVLGAAAAGATAPALAGCASSGTLDRLDIACGEPGGTYIQFGRLLGAAIRDDGLARRSEALVTTGSVDNLARLGAGTARLALCLADSAREAETPLVAIGRVYQNYLQVVVPADSPVRTVEQLRGRTVSVGAPSSGTAATTRRVLGAFGLLGPEPEGVRVVEVRLADAIRRLRGGVLAALAFSSGIPIPALVEVASVFPVRLLDLGAVFARLGPADSGVYVRSTVPAATYAMSADTVTVGVANLLLARPDLPDATASRLVDVVIGRARDLVPAAAAGIQYLTEQTLVDTFPVALHPGAAERYRELHG